MGNSAEAPRDPEETKHPYPVKDKSQSLKNGEEGLLDLIKTTVNYVGYDRSAFLYLINLINLIKSGESAELETKLIERTLNLMRTHSNRRLVSHFFRYRATTRLNIETETGIDEVSISQKLKTLRGIGFIEKRGRVGTPYRARTVIGPGIPLWGIKKGLFLEAQPHDYVDAQRRYGELILATADPTTVRQSQLPEAVAFCKTYMEKRGLVTIPDSGLILPLLKSQGVRVNYDNLVTALKKEGYDW